MARRLAFQPVARVVCLATGLAIAGCAAPTPSTQAAGAALPSAPSSAVSEPTPADPAATQAPSTTPQGSTDDSQGDRRQPAESSGAAKTDNEGPPPASVAQAPSITQLIGLSAGQLRQRLGPAGFVRKDGAAEIWRYSVDDCHVDLFLYREESGARVHHIEARPRNGGRINARTCYERLLTTRRVSMAG
ncbi:MAG TPA: hypothetical protein VLG66_11655 [Alphaproteobacteria bacterium]|nr:hypothetical protein [Alphaproteobacteria bacterium]